MGTKRGGLNLGNFNAMDWGDMRNFDKASDNLPENNQETVEITKNKDPWCVAEEKNVALDYGDIIRVSMKGDVMDYFCQICSIHSNSKATLQMHCNGMKHLKKKKEYKFGNDQPPVENDNNSVSQPRITDLSKPGLSPLGRQIESKSPPRDQNKTDNQPRGFLASFRGSMNDNSTGPNYPSDGNNRRFEDSFNPSPPRGFSSGRDSNGRGYRLSPRRDEFRGRPLDRHRPHPYENFDRRQPEPRCEARPVIDDILPDRFREANVPQNNYSQPTRIPSPPKVDFKHYSHADSLNQLARLSILSDEDAKVSIGVVSSILKSLKCYYQVKSNWIAVDMLIDAELKIGSVAAIETTKPIIAASTANIKGVNSPLRRY